MVVCLILGALVATAAAVAQTSAKTHRIGVQLVGNRDGYTLWRSLPNVKAMLEELGKLGYVEGKNFVIEWRSDENLPQRLPEVAAELAALRPDVIFVGTCGARLDAMRRATRTIPIVVATCNDDMVEAGIAASLAHPGGNVTGQQQITPELSAKRLELLKLVLPRASRIAVMWDPGYGSFEADWRALRGAAGLLRVTLLPIHARGAAEFEAAFTTALAQRAEALITLSDVTSYVNARRIADLAAQYRLPAITPFREATDAGGLVSYGPSITDMFRHSAHFVDKILKGANPAELPIEQPTRFELVINLKTAKALGLTLPQSLLVRADEVIQ
jgi:putative ABC transport system substrate-binding protein